MLSDGAPGRIRTPDPQIRSLVLYPAELPVLLAKYRSSFRELRRLWFGAAAAVAPEQGATPTAEGSGLQVGF